jgi:FKBP-type peptidyl-prolyl cis-trans isomerase FklB
MKQFFLVMGVSVMAVSANAQEKGTAAVADTAKKTISAEPAFPATSLDSFSYALGMNIANNLKQQSITEVNTAAMLRGMEDVYKNSPTAINEQQANMCIQSTLQANSSKKANAEKIRSAQFLSANQKRSGVITLPNGLQYEVIKSGDVKSAMPQLQDTFVANYAGTLVDGKEFDNSYKRGEPLTLPVANVIRGWTEILQMMHIGDKWKVYIPSELGYGDRGMGADIPGGAALIFDMELLGVKKAGVQQPEQQKQSVDKTPKKVGVSKTPAKKKKG